MQIDRLEERIFYLVPDADCQVFGFEYNTVLWEDARPQPSIAALQAVTPAQLDLNWRDFKTYWKIKQVRPIIDLIVTELSLDINTVLAALKPEFKKMTISKTGT